MPVRELIEKYGGKPSEALRRAVRAEYPGGNELLDALIVAARNRDKNNDWRQIYEALISIRDAALSDVALKYELKTVEQKGKFVKEKSAQNVDD